MIRSFFLFRQQKKYKGNMKKYIGVKIVDGEPCQAWKDDQKNKIGDEGYKVKYEDGYISWSPKDTFEKAYRECDTMTFGLAIEALKKGHKVARMGWHGKNMHLEGVKSDLIINPVIFLVKMDLQQADPIYDYQGVWNCTQADMLAEDWKIIE